METEEITRQIIGVWDEEQPEESTAEVAEEPQPESEPEQEPEPEQPEREEGEPEPEEGEPEGEQPEEEEEAEEEEGEPEEEPEEEVTGYQSENPQVQAFLAKYQGDLERALAGAVQLQQVLGRQGQDKAVLTRRVQELEQELQQLRSFGPGPALSPEQRGWVDEAVESQNPVSYVQQALEANEFALARAVCDRWAEDAPYEAGRIAQQIDAAEWRTQQQVEQEQPQLDSGALMGVLIEHFPEMPQYEQQMLAAMNSLGDDHPLVQDARSNEPATAATAIVSIYEIARAQTTSVKTARTKLQRDGRQAADDARARAVVSSAQATPNAGETPRPRNIMPGLTLEALDEAWGSK